MRVEVLRIGHRPQRDPRVTTHVCLVARAFGAQGVTIAEADHRVEATLRSVAARFGGEFHVRAGAGWRRPIQEWREAGGLVVHLTMYGVPLSEAAPAMRASGRDVLVIVGAEKVPGDLFSLADMNVSVGNQPHSEVAALALLLDRLRDGAWENDAFEGARLKIRPSARGKDVVGARAGTPGERKQAPIGLEGDTGGRPRAKDGVGRRRSGRSTSRRTRDGDA